MLKYTEKRVIDDTDWDDFVQKTYNRPYSFQQQDGCKDRGLDYITVPDLEYAYDYERDTIPEVVNGDEIGVSFKAWLERDPNQKIDKKSTFNVDFTDLWWERNFYPHVSMIANDLYNKGLIEAGEYIININW